MNHGHLDLMAGILKSECCLVDIQGVPVKKHQVEVILSSIPNCENPGQGIPPGRGESPFLSQVVLQLVRHSLVLMQLTLHLNEIIYIIINQIYLKRNTDNHMINKNKNKFQVSIAEDRKTQPEIARTD